MGNDNNNRRPSPPEIDGIDLAWGEENSGEIPLELEPTAPKPAPEKHHEPTPARRSPFLPPEEKSGPRARDPALDLDLDLDLPPIVTPDTPGPDDSIDLAADRPFDPRASYGDLSLEIGGDDPIDLAMRERNFDLELETPILPAEEDPSITAMRDRYAAGDFTGALVLAEGLLDGDPEHEEANRYANSCREVLTQMYAARLGSLDQAPTVAIPADQIRWLSLDHRSGFLLSLVDGNSTIDEILDISGMSRLDALRIMYTLLEQRIISLESG